MPKFKRGDRGSVVSPTEVGSSGSKHSKGGGKGAEGSGAQGAAGKTDKKKDKVDKKKQQAACMRMLPVAFKLILSMGGQLREVLGQLWSTWIVESKSAIVTRTKEATGKYSSRIKKHKEAMDALPAEEREEHVEGPPHLPAFGGFLLGLAEDLKTKKAEELGKYFIRLEELCQDMDGEEAAQKVFVRRVSKTHMSNFAKVQLAFAGQGGEWLPRISEAMKLLGAKHKVGMGPATAMERLLQQALDGGEED